jgi:hypothetical protein
LIKRLLAHAKIDVLILEGPGAYLTRETAKCSPRASSTV